MKLKYEMEIIDLDGSPMAVPVDSADEFRGVLHMNATAQSILEALKNDVSEDEIASALKKEYAATDEQIRMNIAKVLGILRQYDLLCE